MIINYLNMSPVDAKKYFRRAYILFKKVIDKDKNLYDYNLRFDWDSVEEIHEYNAKNEFNCNDFYFISGEESYSLDISHDIDNFGYNADYFKSKYADVYDDLYCCVICTYRNYYEYESMITQVIFLYDRKNDRVVEALDISHFSRVVSNNQHIRKIEDEKVLKKLIKV